MKNSLMYGLFAACTLLLGACVDSGVDEEDSNSERIPLSYQIVEAGDSTLEGSRSEIYALFLQEHEGMKVLVQDSSSVAMSHDSCLAIFMENMLQDDTTGEHVSLNSAWRKHPQEIAGIVSRYRDSNRVSRDWKPLRLSENVYYSYAVAQPQEEGWFKSVAESFPGYDRIVSLGWAEIMEEEGLAIVYVSEFRAPLNASGDYYFLEKKDGKWVVTDSVNVWVS